MINKIKELIGNSTAIAVLCHVNADGDALCSSFALADVLSAMGKKPVCLLEECPGKKYDFLGGEYVVFDEESEYSFDLAIAVDCGSDDRLGKRLGIFNESEHTINIDHHKSNNNFGEVNLVKFTYCAAAEVLAELFENMGVELSSNAARLLYGGIMSDSGCLKFSSTTSETHIRVSKLLKHGFDHAEVTRQLFDSNSMEITKLTGFVMNNVESYENGLVTLISTDSALLESYCVDERDANNLINIPRSVAGSEIAVELKERGGVVRVSLRSNGAAEVDRVAALFGGGGHIRAAGATLTGLNLNEAKKVILEAVSQELVRSGIREA